MTAVEWYDATDEVIASRAPRNTGARVLAEWWHQLASGDLEALLPKAIEYSAHDLEMTGEAMRSLLSVPLSETGVESAELTCWFYLLSKVMRAVGAIKEGREPSEDTITDVRIYATMIARIRDTGSWPGVKVDG